MIKKQTDIRAAASPLLFPGPAWWILGIGEFRSFWVIGGSSGGGGRCLSGSAWNAFRVFWIGGHELVLTMDGSILTIGEWVVVNSPYRTNVRGDHRRRDRKNRLALEIH